MKCSARPLPVYTINAERSLFDVDPPYQREAGVWSQEKQQLFLDSLMNGYDIPKLYLREVTESTRGTPAKYAVVDGKQRLTAIWRFINNDYPTSDDFQWDDAATLCCQAKLFRELPQQARDALLARPLDCVLIATDDEEDIEEMFFRLNNGSPLNAAEKRNAIGGKTVELIRRLATRHRFFADKIAVPPRRMAHHEIAAKCILSGRKGGVTDLKKKFLDNLATQGRNVDDRDIAELEAAVGRRLDNLCRVFSDRDPLLRKQATVPLYYLLDRHLQVQYALSQYHAKLHTFIENFEAQRVADRALEEDKRDAQLLHFDLLSQQGTNDQGSLEGRVSILTRRFLRANPDATLKDRRRSFNDDERFAIWILGGKKCANCERQLNELSDMHADHATEHAAGGQTTIANGRCLCVSCNTSRTPARSRSR